MRLAGPLQRQADVPRIRFDLTNDERVARDAADIRSPLCRGTERNGADSHTRYCPFGPHTDSIRVCSAVPHDQPAPLRPWPIEALRADAIRVLMHVLLEEIRTRAVRFDAESEQDQGRPSLPEPHGDVCDDEVLKGRTTAMPTLEFKGKSFIYAHHLSVPVSGIRRGSRIVGAARKENRKTRGRFPIDSAERLS